MKFSWIICLFLLCFSLFNCDRKTEKIPAYLVLDSISIIPVINQGNQIHNIDGVFVFVDEIFLGSFPLPCKIPVLSYGSKKVSITPLVRENGSASVFRKLNCIKNTDTVLFFEAKKATYLSNIKVNYRDNTEFVWIEDFEDNVSTLVSTISNAKSDTSYIKTDWFNLNNRFGKNSKVLYAEIADSDTSKYFDLRTFSYFKNLSNTDKGIKIIMVEFDIKSNSEVQLGFQRRTNIGEVYEPYLGIKNTNNKWLRVYCDFTYATASKPIESEYKIVYSMYKRAEDNYITKVYFDNFKITYLN